MSEADPSPRDAEWLAREQARLDALPLGPASESFGHVVHAADGIARIAGLPEVCMGELLQFANGAMGFALTLDTETVEAVVLDDLPDLGAGTRASGTGDVVRVPVGEALLGRVIDPLGRPLDGRPAPACHETWPIERPAPAIIERDLVSEPVETGVLVVDALFALGRGQRELVIGDRATGKTSLALDAIIAQKYSDMICIYVAVGQRASAVERAIEAVRAHGAPERCIFVVAPAAAAPGLQWIAPFAGFSIGEWFRARGQHALIVVDDLTKHAATHRELALLTREPPGREAYPGDVFYLHARLLERAGKLSAELGGGSLTAIPIAETDAGNLSAYIPTNLISITDGQIVLDSRLFAANQRPSVNVGLSVSRVGGKAQKPAMRQFSGRVRLEYAQFLELEMFTRFGGMSDTRVKGQLARGQAIRALLEQPRFTPLRAIDQIALLAALEDGAFDTLSTQDLRALRSKVGARIDAGAHDAITAIEEGRTLDDAQKSALIRAVGNG
ncbi:F0F1 ATP synthase subunit alpha [Novosphingobium nitrogenifigens DSM 19370]|uniref:ATP synthase subunit alpha n=1 Tax=Novosphingobium nitrogenifigens DSM 19370 TaxID=983920 RepID=F1ZAB5_9SPHN|nr:F0F1 ATP synthase subunit alpha [Novosphingobium nitrogenifigens]EGD58477.1 F0F1 ATP synthase subunit alpha [Novosphingobium nitrogenifigens DSM 19370]